MPDTIELAKDAAKQGVYGVAMMSPAFYKPTTPEGLAKNIIAVAKEVPNTPFYYYHIPFMSGMNFPVRKAM